MVSYAHVYLYQYAFIISIAFWLEHSICQIEIVDAYLCSCEMKSDLSPLMKTDEETGMCLCVCVNTRFHDCLENKA